MPKKIAFLNELVLYEIKVLFYWIICSINNMLTRAAWLLAEAEVETKFNSGPKTEYRTWFFAILIK